VKRLALLLAVIPFATLRLFGGCASQSEGQLCNTLNNTNSDCAAGLVCQTFGGEGTLGACCPQAPAVSTQPACVMSGNTSTSTGTGSGGSSTTTSSSSTSSTTGTTTTTTTTSGTGGSEPGDAGTDGSGETPDGGDGG
jgi:hypothetical protein